MRNATEQCLDMELLEAIEDGINCNALTDVGHEAFDCWTYAVHAAQLLADCGYTVTTDKWRPTVRWSKS